jgi:hypothetical protein
METINLKYSTGDIIYFIKQVSIPVWHVCNICQGEGKLFSKAGTEITCFKCDGHKKISNGGTFKEEVSEGTVSHIHIDVYWNRFPDQKPIDNLIIYTVETSGEEWGIRALHEEDIYTTKEEAQKNIKEIKLAGYTK